ncbi:hypothetical protein H9P43_001931 [Blastocladiella emersonii ATCC 22665]|nr:hypothetical protein H9P43_001931 [Blastocladiella emersonii ATCC 22665]
MVVLPAAAYLDQYWKVMSTKSLGNFNLGTSGLLIVCNLLRIAYWVPKQFSTVLLTQSWLMLATQLMLLEGAVRIRNWQQKHDAAAAAAANPMSPGAVIAKPIRSPRVYFANFWNWPTFGHYLFFIFILVGLPLLLIPICFDVEPWFYEPLGALALGIEATVPMPQAYSNWRNKSVQGISAVVILSWFGGDLFKIFYYIANDAPAAFLACGIVQFTVDLVICGQIVTYTKYQRVAGKDSATVAPTAVAAPASPKSPELVPLANMASL